MLERNEARYAEFETRLGFFKDVLTEWQETPPGKDVYIAAFAGAVEQSLGDSTRLGAFLKELLAARDVGSTTLATKVLRATQRQMLFGGWDKTNGDYPRSFHTPEQWQKGFDWIFAEEGGIKEEEFFIDVWSRPLQSNVSERYMAFKAFVVLARKLGRLSSVSMLDIGTSQMAGPNHLASGLAFPPPNFVMPGSTTNTPHLPRTAAFHEIINSPLDNFEAVGSDLFKLADGWEWAWACSHYPSELEDEVRVERIRSLMGEIYPNVTFAQANFTDLGSMGGEFKEQYGKRKFTITHWSNVLEQLSQEDQEAMIREAEPLTEEFMMVNGFMEIDPNDPRRLVPRDDWFDPNITYRYNTFVRDMKSGDERWHKIFKWTNARMEQVTMRRGRIALLGASGGVERRVSLWAPLNELARNHGLRGG